MKLGFFLAMSLSNKFPLSNIYFNMVLLSVSKFPNRALSQSFPDQRLCRPVSWLLDVQHRLQNSEQQSSPPLCYSASLTLHLILSTLSGRYSIFHSCRPTHTHTVLHSQTVTCKILVLCISTRVFLKFN